MTKTPQQIRNEVEKEIEKLKKKVYKKLGTDKCPDKDYVKMDNWEEFYDGDLINLNAKLSILTEYDKSIKEMIEGLNFSNIIRMNYNNLSACEIEDKIKQELISQLEDDEVKK